ncbi:MAG: hypothetical protein KVP17_003051 [Porospora cf. gigantea B]|uniref:uncharacterized protein n=1 Tax=Porospora cf. gigantea B TaxID=2853592 RepID=UPI0035719120|nr:MAG: hypothetical protein KVP17_003051 [Porospora cf. gigantea B]
MLAGSCSHTPPSLEVHRDAMDLKEPFPPEPELIPDAGDGPSWDFDGDDDAKFKPPDFNPFFNRFRQRHRQLEWAASNLVMERERVTFSLSADDVVLEGELSLFSAGFLRLFIGSSDRFKADSSVIQEGDMELTDVTVTRNDSQWVIDGPGRMSAVLTLNPFRLDMLLDREIVNSVDGIHWENYPAPAPSVWKGFEDSTPNGWQAVGASVVSPATDAVYGLPQHTGPLNLLGRGPLRLFNVDAFGYEDDRDNALYGTVPFVLVPQGSVYSAQLWLNPADTYYVPPTTDGNRSSWVSETNCIDIVLFAADSSISVLNSLSVVTGFPSLPPLFALGKHQCRWNYDDESDVLDVSKGFALMDIPLDTMWLDIEHTDRKRYFTWDNEKFPDPQRLLRDLSTDGRHLVAIIDPHVAKDSAYDLYADVLDAGVLSDASGEVFVGDCWPGRSVYPDFLDPRVREVWMGHLAGWLDWDNRLHVWNDMNEPSVFESPEMTLPKDARHVDGREHREVHNLYGMFYHRTTFEGLMRARPSKRPFVLSRAFFVGSQKYGAIWFGDSISSTEHLAMTSRLLLSHAVAGLSFTGGDVGGFFGDPSEDLLLRWSEVGIWQPFYRDHAHIESRRREPWLFSAETLARIRHLAHTRYRVLHYWYTAFFDYHAFGVPVIRMEDQRDDVFWVGSSILVVPVLRKPVELPILRLFALDSDQEFVGGSVNETTAFVREGSILLTKTHPGRSTETMRGVPFRMEIYPNVQGEASGSLFLDDGESTLTGGNFAVVDFYASISESGVVVTCAPRLRLDRPLTTDVTGLQMNPILSPVLKPSQQVRIALEHVNTSIASIRVIGWGAGDLDQSLLQQWTRHVFKRTEL